MATYYRCDIKTITNLMRRRILPFLKIGRLVRFDLQECDRAMEKYQRKSRLLEISSFRFGLVPRPSPPAGDASADLSAQTSSPGDPSI